MPEEGSTLRPSTYNKVATDDEKDEGEDDWPLAGVSLRSIHPTSSLSGAFLCTLLVQFQPAVQALPARLLTVAASVKMLQLQSQSMSCW
jgi:hypothetical protein